MEVGAFLIVEDIDLRGLRVECGSGAGGRGAEEKAGGIFFKKKNGRWGETADDGEDGKEG